jgi:Ser/Thr protein kinase RdoA (MazF antagonist)
VARPLGYCEQTRTVWQDQADGAPLVEALRSGVDASLPTCLAHAWAHLHAAPRALAGPQTRDAAHWLVEVQRRRNKISRVVPELADRVARVGDALERGAARLAAHPPGVIHGDCHPEQVWLAGTRVVLFDFDEFALGDPMEDLASFVVKLGALDRSGELVHALLRAYARLAPEQFDPRRLRWHAAVQQLLQASRAFVFQVPDWRAALERRLASAEALCARESGAARSASMPAQAAMLA